MFTKSIIAASIAGLAAAAPAPAARANANVLQLIAIHSGSPIQGANIEENDLRFWIGKDTTTYCPSEVVTCPTGNQTAIYMPSTPSGAVGMNTEVPGGQQVYVTEDGEVGVTQAHSAFIPEGAVTTSFSYTAPQGEGNVGSLLFNSNSFSACPQGTAGEYQIFANGAAKFTRTDCIGIAMGTAETQAEPVWQYI